MTRDDLATFAEWLARPHWREWWGEPETELAMLVDMVEGRDATRPFIFSRDGRPLGYIQLWFVGPHQEPAWTNDNPWLAELPPGAVGVDLSIAAEEDLSRGLGSAALRAFATEVRRAGAATIVIDPDIDNARAVRAYSRAGFRPVAALEGRSGDVLIMQFHPDSETP
ncbi:MAG: GNAT family N-acetyltransferase [Salinarimonadaceae bacterium]|nr:MAG: GNAT family N-acetyltransferase [Salinarimonadaceae bacterium]